MRRNLDGVELELDDYEESYDENFYSTEAQEEHDDKIEVEDESSYKDFNAIVDVDLSEDDYEEEPMETKKEIKTYSYHPNASILSNVLNLFIGIGVVLAVIVMAYYLMHGSISSMFIFIFLLIIAYGLGYVCTYLIMEYFLGIK